MTHDELIEECARGLMLRRVGTVTHTSRAVGREAVEDVRAILATVRKVLSETEMQQKLVNVGVGAILTSKDRPAIISQHEALKIALPAMLAASPLGEIEG